MVRRLVLLGPLLAACGSEPRPLPPEVDAVVEARCRRCHDDPPQNFAPMPLVTWDDFNAKRRDRRVYVIVEARIQSVDFPMPPFETPENAAFTDGERQILLDWIAAGAPPGEPTAQ